MLEFLVSIDWLKVASTVATCCLAVAAFSALTSWKRQDKAKKQADFLDELADTVHEYIQSVARPNEHLRYVRIGFESYRNTVDAPDGTLEQGAIAYIKRVGSSDCNRLWESLEPCMKLSAKINALVARGQVYGLRSYDSCRAATTMLVWQQQRLKVVASMLGNGNINWENPVVQNSLAKMLTVQPDDILNHLNENNAKFLSFVRDNYEKVYFGT